MTGDTHGDFSRFRKKMYPELDALTKQDFVIICGDFGGVWQDCPEETFWLNWLDARPFTTLFISGNHENYDRLNALPVADWSGGKVQYIRPSILHLMRGQVFQIGGKRFFTMGGARSHDISDGILEPDDPDFRLKRKRLEKRHAYYRVNHQSWWKEELPNAEEYQTARDSLEAAGWQVDYILTHCCPTPVQSALTEDCQPDELTDFLEEVRQRCQFQYWFFGHYHSNLSFAFQKQQFHLLYENIMVLQE